MTQRSEFENKIAFMQQIVAPDDIYLFATSLMETNAYLAALVFELNNTDTVTKNYPSFEIIAQQIIDYARKYREKDLAPLEFYFSEE